MILENAAHVVVIGSGLAGLTSTIEAARNGAKVTLIEKEASIGGNSAKATSGINGSETKYQMDAGIKDSIEEFENDTLKSGGDFCDKSLVKVLASQSKSAIEWLSSFGLNLAVLSQCGGHSVKRTHREPDVNGRPAPVGWDIISALRKHVENDLKDQVTVKVNTKLTDMVVENDRLAKIVTVDSQGTAEEFEADSFVLTTGGFSADKSYNDSLLKEFAPNLLSLATTNGKWATGDGVKIARKIGVSLVDMDKVQVHPTGFVSLEDPENHQKFLAPEALRGHGGILVNSFGNRFCNELGLRDEVTGSIFANCSRLKGSQTTVAYLILDEKMAKDFGKGALEFYIKKKLFLVCSDISQVAAVFGCKVEDLKDTILNYGKDDKFGKKTFPRLFSLDENQTFYVAAVTPSIHYTMGGIRINAAAEVLKESDQTQEIPIKGLFAAGEVTGGVHGKNRLAGNSLLECVVFGRIAGRHAALSNSVSRGF